jgi:hypothetical protein
VDILSTSLVLQKTLEFLPGWENNLKPQMTVIDADYTEYYENAENTKY